MKHSPLTPCSKMDDPYQWLDAVHVELIWATGGRTLFENREEVQEILGDLLEQNVTPTVAAHTIIQRLHYKYA